MINLYSGTPGSGKSLHLARRVSDSLAINKKDVIANFPINMELVTKKGRRKTGRFTYLTNDKLTVDFLIEYARKYHKVGKEGQTLLVIDEAGIMFNSRDYGAFDRKAWINFFMTHRHFGYDVILVSQIDRLIDRQIRAFIEYDIKHRKANNFKFIGMMLTVFRIPLFVAITYWYGVKERCDAEFFRYRKKDSKLYDTMMLFGEGQHGESIGAEEESDEFTTEDDIMPPSAADGDGESGSAGGVPIDGNSRVRLYVYFRKLFRDVWDYLNKPIVSRGAESLHNAECNTNIAAAPELQE